MVIHGRSWSFMVIHGHSWSFMVIHGHSWSFMVIHGHSWSFMVIHGHSWSFMVIVIYGVHARKPDSVIEIFIKKQLPPRRLCCFHHLKTLHFYRTRNKVKKVVGSSKTGAKCTDMVELHQQANLCFTERRN